MISFLRRLAYRILRGFFNTDLSAYGYGPNGGFVVDRKLAETIREIRNTTDDSSRPPNYPVGGIEPIANRDGLWETPNRSRKKTKKT